MVESVLSATRSPSFRGVSAALTAGKVALAMVDGIQGPSSEMRRRAARPRSSTAIGLRVLTVVVVVVGLAVAAVSAASGQPQRPSAQPPWIVFTAHPSGHGVEQIFRIKQSGEGLKQLTRGNYSAAAPAFSPDGKRIAFVRLGTGIMSMNLDGTGVRRLTSNGRDNLPTWSPDGKQIAFIRPSAKGWGVYVMSASGTGERRAPPGASRRPAVLDGQRTPDSDRGRPRPDQSSNRARLQVVRCHDRRDRRHERDRCLAGSLARSRMSAPHRRIPGTRTAATASPARGSRSTSRIFGKHKAPRILARDAGPASFSPDGKRLAFVAKNRIVLWALANGKSTSIKTGNVIPTVATPPVWQPR